MTLEKMNPAAEASADGAWEVVTGGEHPEHTAHPQPFQDSDRPARVAARERRAVVERRMHARWRGEAFVEAWHNLTDWEAEFVTDLLLTGTLVGMPIPPLGTTAAEAAEWTSWASRDERRKYLTAIWRSLPQVDREAFLGRVAQ